MQAVTEMKCKTNTITASNSGENGEHTSEKEPKRALGVLEGKIWMSSDFDKPLEDFKEYM